MTLTAANDIPLLTLAGALADAGLVLRPDMRGGLMVVQASTEPNAVETLRERDESR